MNLPSNIAKSSLLAGLIFWSVGGVDSFDSTDIIPLIFISYIPICISCAVTIFITICPFFWLAETPSLGKRAIFKRYFPYYCIVCFALCSYGVYINRTESFLIGFFTAVFISTMQSWVWFATERSS